MAKVLQTTKLTASSGIDSKTNGQHLANFDYQDIVNYANNKELDYR
jgi:hypothetical protein